MARIFIAMSGGVDSSVAAALLAEAGHDVTGVTMRLFDAAQMPGGPPADATPHAIAVCKVLGIEHRAIEMRHVFWPAVVDATCDAYAAGLTPNPCIICNELLKFGELLRTVEGWGADALATGHYARVVTGPDGGKWLARGADTAKDQSYFLYRLTAQQLESVMFPLGEMTKEQVRDKARALGLPTAELSESQEVCFAPAGLGEYVAETRPETAVPGDVVDESGAVVGRHRGVARVTVGQRKGLQIGGGERRFVRRVDAANNSVVVGDRESLLVESVVARDAVWRGGEAPMRVTARLRYRSPEAEATASCEDGRLRVDFARPVEVSAPGQAVVCWAGDRVVGGGVLEVGT